MAGYDETVVSWVYWPGPPALFRQYLALVLSWHVDINIL